MFVLLLSFYQIFIKNITIHTDKTDFKFLINKKYIPKLF